MLSECPIQFGLCHHINIYQKVNNLIHNWIYPLMGKVHKNFHTRMDDLQVYELPQQDRPLTK